MRTVKRLFFLLGCLLLAAPLAAQQTWTLKECLAYSRKNNLSVRQQEYEQSKNQLRLHAARRKFLPVMDARWRSASNWGFLIDPSTNILDRKFNLGNQVSLNANWDLFNGSASGHQARVYARELQAASFLYESAVHASALEVIYLYLQVLLSEQQRQNVKQRLGQLQNQFKLVKRQVSEGLLHKRDLLNLQSVLAAEELQLVLAENTLEKAGFTLMQTMGLVQDSLIGLSPLPVSDSLLAASFARLAAEPAGEDHFPEVKASQARVDAAQANELVVRDTRLPVLSLSSQMGSRTSSAREEGFNNQLKENFNQQVGLSLTMPIFNNNLFQTNASLAKLETEQAKVAHRQIRQQVRQRILTARLDFQAAYRKFQAAQTSYQALQEEFRFADKQLGLGLINAIAFGEVRSRFFAAQSQLWQDRYDCLFKWKILQYYQGEALY